MLVIPSLFLKDGRCVRSINKELVDLGNPLEIVNNFYEQGAKRLHLIDLGGAVSGGTISLEAVAKITATFPDIDLQLGGGIRNFETVEFYFSLGVRYCIIGSKAVTNPEFIEDLVEEFPERIIVGIDSRNGLVTTNGWTNISNIQTIDLVKNLPANVREIIHTDINKDGQMKGSNLTETCTLAQATSTPVIASGGISGMDELRQLAANGVYGAIIGRALYSGTINLADALAL